jgi:2,3,4,5-tetrahydropyridine-2-carboxylate N-succinyltransferase
VNAAELADFYQRPAETVLADPRHGEAHASLLAALEAGALRAAQRGSDGAWNAVAWVKQAILLGFRAGAVTPLPGPWGSFHDKATFPVRQFTAADGVRVVPGGTSVRRGAHLAPGVVVMPPAYVNVGAFVGAGTMIDSHALVGSCAQIGARVHLSAAVQVGGVLEPPGAAPVVVEDEAFVGAGSILVEGVCVRSRAVLAAGVVLSRASVIHDLVREREWQREVPEGAVVVPGSRPAKGAYGERQHLQLATPVIVKYRDAKTDAATALEQALR